MTGSEGAKRLELRPVHSSEVEMLDGQGSTRPQGRLAGSRDVERPVAGGPGSYWRFEPAVHGNWHQVASSVSKGHTRPGPEKGH